VWVILSNYDSQSSFTDSKKFYIFPIRYNQTGHECSLR
jgi:hypothetical protein